MEGANESTELWRHPNPVNFLAAIKMVLCLNVIGSFLYRENSMKGGERRSTAFNNKMVFMFHISDKVSREVCKNSSARRRRRGSRSRNSRGADILGLNASQKAEGNGE